MHFVDDVNVRVRLVNIARLHLTSGFTTKDADHPGILLAQYMTRSSLISNPLWLYVDYWTQL